MWFCPCGGQSVCLPAYLRTVHHNQMDKLVQVSLASSTLSQAQLWGWFSENTAKEISLSLSLSPPPGHRSRSRLPGDRPTHAVGWERSVKKRIAPVEFSFSLSLSLSVYIYIHIHKKKNIYIYITHRHTNGIRTYKPSVCNVTSKDKSKDLPRSGTVGRRNGHSNQKSSRQIQTDAQTDRPTGICVCVHTHRGLNTI